MRETDAAKRDLDRRARRAMRRAATAATPSAEPRARCVEYVIASKEPAAARKN
jgi:hypothetical protein